MDESAGSPRRARRWTRVEGRSDAAGHEPIGQPLGHRLAVYPARIVRCSCGAAILATDPEALRGPVTDLADDVLSLHAAWCEELEVADFVTPLAANGHGHSTRAG